MQLVDTNASSEDSELSTVERHECLPMHGVHSSVQARAGISLAGSGLPVSQEHDTQFRTTNMMGRASRLSAGRTMAALARPVVGIGAAYYTWGWLLPLAAEGAVSGFNALAREGEQWRRGTPETSVGFRDMATRERAFTMRQASSMAIHTSQMGVRAALGNEANFLHG